MKAAITSLELILGESLFIDASFFNNLSNEVELGGFFMIDLTFGGKVSPSSIFNNGTGHGPVDLFLRVNKFVSTATLSASSLDLDFPLNLPSPGVSGVDALLLSLEDGSIKMNVFLHLTKPRNITDLFDGGKLTNFEYGGNLDTIFPVKLAVDSDTGSQFDLGFTLFVPDENIVSPPLPVIEYNLDICSVVDSLKDAIAGFTGIIMDVSSNSIKGILSAGPYINHHRLSTPLMEYVNMTLGNFSDIFNNEVNITCVADRRFLRETNSSLANIINAAFDNLNNFLQSIGITINANVQPYFDSTKFAVGVSTELSVDFQLVRNLL